MTEETKAFIETWKRKISSYTDNKIDTSFDKFSSLYTLFNRLYNESYRQLKSDKRLSKPGYSDIGKATNLVIEFNSAIDILERLKSNNNGRDIETIANLIRNDVFHINLADGVSQKDRDIILLGNLENKDPDIKVQAVLSTIYNVRSNMVHGEKHIEEHQSMLLEPLIRILETIIELQIEKF